MLLTKLLSITSSLNKNQAIKIIILLIEIGLVLYAIAEAEKEERNTIDIEEYN